MITYLQNEFAFIKYCFTTKMVSFISAIVFFFTVTQWFDHIRMVFISLVVKLRKQFDKIFSHLMKRDEQPSNFPFSFPLLNSFLGSIIL